MKLNLNAKRIEFNPDRRGVGAVPEPSHALTAMHEPIISGLVLAMGVLAGLSPVCNPHMGGMGAVRGPGGLLARWPSHGSAEK